MDFRWTPEQTELRDSIIEFARAELNEGVLERDRLGTFPRENWRKCAEFGIQGLCMPRAHGGLEQDLLTALCAMEALGYACRDNGLIFALHAQMWSVQTPLLRFGSEEQKARYLPPLIRGEWIGAHCMTEPDSGSDPFSLATRADRDGSDYRLHGSKTFSSNAPVADVFLVFATRAKARGFLAITAFLVDRGTEGLTVGKPIEKMGLRSSPLAEVILDGCRVPEANRLGKEGLGGSIFNHSMLWERSGILASAIGTMERQLEETIAQAKRRKQFGRPIGKFQAVSHRLADMAVRLETARLLLYKTGWMHCEGQDATMHSAMTKLYLSECFLQSSLDALQIHGGYGYATESHFERDVRDAVGARIYSGTSEIQRELIARALGL